MDIVFATRACASRLVRQNRTRSQTTVFVCLQAAHEDLQ